MFIRKLILFGYLAGVFVVGSAAMSSQEACFMEEPGVAMRVADGNFTRSPKLFFRDWRQLFMALGTNPGELLKWLRSVGVIETGDPDLVEVIARYEQLLAQFDALGKKLLPALDSVIATFKRHMIKEYASYKWSTSDYFQSLRDKSDLARLVTLSSALVNPEKSFVGPFFVRAAEQIVAELQRTAVITARVGQSVKELLTRLLRVLQQLDALDRVHMGHTN